MDGVGGLTMACLVAGAVLVGCFGYVLVGISCRVGSLMGVRGVFTGGVVVALAVSMPEIAGSLGAVMAETPDPDLAVGVPLGCVLFNLLIFAAAGLLPGGRVWVGCLGLRDLRLGLLGCVLLAGSVAFGVLGFSAGLWHLGLGSVALVVIYGGGLRALASAGGSVSLEGGRYVAPGLVEAGRVWAVLWLVLIGVVVGSYLLVYGVGRLAGELGVSAAGVGVVPLAAVMSVPELVLVVGALRTGREKVAALALFGGICLNVLALCFADGGLEAVVWSLFGKTHLIAGVAGAVVMVLIVVFLRFLRDRWGEDLGRAVLGLAVVGCLLGLMGMVGIG